VHRGATSRGTPVWVNRAYAAADLKIVIGNIEPHQFVGFSGGVKTAAIGLAGAATINRNHALMTDPDSRLGDYETNPARQDVEEIGECIGVHFALNAILNSQRRIVRVLAGAPRAVMGAGVPLSREICQATVAARYGVMITSPGGHPKDLNLYQAQKALAHAALVARPGGAIILVAACPEGTGSPHYKEWMAGKRSHEEVIARFRAEGFRIGPHKAFQIARDATAHRVIFCSDMEADRARALLLNPVRDLQAALTRALPALQPGERIGFLPHASSTIPRLASAPAAGSL
jgi:nickel-dependent lactate racemase